VVGFNLFTFIKSYETNRSVLVWFKNKTQLRYKNQGCSFNSYLGLGLEHLKQATFDEINIYIYILFEDQKHKLRLTIYLTFLYHGLKTG
jgi:hypothetical protein